MAQESDSKPTPPYAPWQTFFNLVMRMEKEGVPSRIDATYLGNSMAGGTQAQIKHALRSLGFIDENGYTDPSLDRLVRGSGDRPAIIADILRERYEPLVEIGDDVTAGQFSEILREEYGLNGATARKAMTFFLSAAEFAHLPVSPHLKLPRAGAIGRRTGRPRKKAATAPPTSPVERNTPANVGERRSVALASGATLTLDCSVPLLTLPAAELAKVLRLINAFDALGAAPTATAKAAPKQTSAPPQESGGAADPAQT
jgi:hypothetical protein